MIDWNLVGNIAAVASAVCAFVCTIVCVRISRGQARSANIGKIIIEGDAAVKQHTEESVAEIRETVTSMSGSVEEMREAIERIEVVQSERQKQVESMRDGIARIETDAKYALRGSSLTPLHDKINAVSNGLAAAQAKSTAENLALGEQLKVVQRLVERSFAPHRSDR